MAKGSSILRMTSTHYPNKFQQFSFFYVKEQIYKQFFSVSNIKIVSTFTVLEIGMETLSSQSPVYY
jgi:hypothetical protein